MKIFAAISFYPLDKGERTYYTGYIPAFKIRDDMYNSGKIDFIEREIAKSGENIHAYITFLHDHFVEDFIWINKKIFFGEGDIIFGEGIILSLVQA